MKDFEQRVLERMPSSEEERASLGRVWNHVERAGGRIPDDVLRSVQERLPARHQRARTFLPKAVAAVLILGAAIGTAIVWPRGVQAYAAGADGLQVTLADNSRVEMRAHSEMTVGPASDGIQIDLKKGDIIVTAAKQRNGHLHVHTKDMTIAVAGTVFLVTAANDGSRVAVIEGEVRVREGSLEKRLRPGEQVSTSPALALRPVKEAITWSRFADSHLAILESFTTGLARTAGTLQPLANAGGQSPAGGQASSPEFEEASVRECDPNNLPPVPEGARGGGANSFQMTPGRTYALCMTPATLIRTAYGYGPAQLEFLNPGGRRSEFGFSNVYGLGVEDGRRVRGGPDWVHSQRYTIEAVAGSPADAAAMSGPMLRSLLERRFKLEAHIETEQIPAFNLVLAPGGLKIKPVAVNSVNANGFVNPEVAETGACEPTPAPTPGEPFFFRPRNFADVRKGAKPSCGATSQPNGPNHVIVGGATTLATLGRLLGGPLGNVQVVDKTGVADAFNIVLEFVWDENTPGERRVMPAAGTGADVPRASTIFTALEEQLGLRLEPAKVPREFIVIDHVERPSPN